MGLPKLVAENLGGVLRAFAADYVGAENLATNARMFCSRGCTAVNNLAGGLLNLWLTKLAKRI